MKTSEPYLVSLAVTDLDDDGASPWAFYVVVEAESPEAAQSAGEKWQVRWLRFLIGRKSEERLRRDESVKSLYELASFEAGHLAGVLVVIPVAALAVQFSSELVTRVQQAESMTGVLPEDEF